MGYAISWLASKAPEDVLLSALDFALTDEIEAIPESPACYRRLPNGWRVIFSNDMEILPDDQLRKLSQSGQLVAGAVEEHTMYSQSEYWVDGNRVFKAIHDSSKSLDHIDIDGTLPAQLRDVPSRLRAEQHREEARVPKIDSMFDLPVELAAALTGYRYNEGEDDEHWIVLRAAGQRAAKPAGAARSGCMTLIVVMVVLLLAASIHAEVVEPPPVSPAAEPPLALQN